MTRPLPYTPGFLKFWSFCLEQLGSAKLGGKQAAMKAWKDHALEGRADEVIDKMRVMVEEVYTPDYKYTPHISTWINAGYYDNEMDTKEQRNQKKFNKMVDDMVKQGYDRKNWIN